MNVGCRCFFWLTTGLLLSAPAFAVRVEVVTADGKPVAEAVVRGFVNRATQALIEMRRASVASGTTDATGGVDLALPSLSRILLVVDAPGLAPRIVAVDPGTAAPLHIALDAGTSHRGKVQVDGPPSGRACVTWQRSLESLGQTLGFERCTSLGTEGSFSISGLDPHARGRLTISAEGYLPFATSWPLAKADAIRLGKGIAIQGIVSGPGDRPIPGARIVVTGASEATSDTDGRFEARVASLPARLAVQAPGFRRREMEIHEPASVRIVLSPGATLQARVLDGLGKPIEKLSLLLSRQTRDNTWTRDEAFAVTHRGDLLLDLPSPGLYRFEVRAPGLRPFASEKFAISETQGANLGIVTLSAGGGVEGWVSNALTGRSLPGVLVTLWPQGLAGLQRAITSTSVPQAVTDYEGRYRIVGQAEGACELRFERTGFAPASQEVAIQDDVILPLEDQRLGTGVAVHGTVKNRAGKARAGVHVRFLAESGASQLPVTETTTGEDGVFDEVALAPGRYRVEVRSDRVLLAQTATIDGSKPEQKLDLRTAETAAFGVVLRRSQPVPGGLLSAEVANLATPRMGQLLLRTPEGSQEVFGAPGSPHFETEIGADGSFSFDDVPAGRLLFTYQTPEGRSLSRAVDLPADGSAALAIDFTGATIQGLARMRRTGEPVAEVAVELRDGDGSPLGSAVTDAAGCFVFDDVSALDVLLEASKPGFRAGVNRVSLQGQSNAPVALDLEAADTGTVTVRLSGRGGQPLGFAFVTLLTEAGTLVRSLPLDALGSRQFEDVPAGVYRIVWTDPAFGLGTSAPVSVQAGQEALVEQQLSSPAYLELVCQANGCSRSPLEGLNLFAAQGLDLASLLPGFSPGLAMSADGRLSLGAIQPGDYQLAVRLAGASSSVTLHATAGQAVRVPVGPPPPTPSATRVAAAPR